MVPATSLALDLVSIGGLMALVVGTALPGLAPKSMQLAADVWVFIPARHLKTQRACLRAEVPARNQTGDRLLDR